MGEVIRFYLILIGTYTINEEVNYEGMMYSRKINGFVTKIYQENPVFESKYSIIIP